MYIQNPYIHTSLKISKHVNNVNKKGLIKFSRFYIYMYITIHI